MKKFAIILLYIGSCVTVIFSVLLILATLNAPAEVVLPSIFICTGIPIVIIANRRHIFSHRQPRAVNAIQPTEPTASIVTRKSISTPVVSPRKERLPRKETCRKIADALIADAKKAIASTHQESSITSYFATSSIVREKLNSAIKYEEKAEYDRIERPSVILQQFEKEFQWKLRDTIEREGVYLIHEMSGRQRNNRLACCQSFLDEIECYKSLFTDETLQFAMNTYYTICSSSNVPINIKNKDDGVDPMERIDKMDGHEFEYYCAELLRNNGFSNVNVTKGSGDQGIDILAEKDGIKYAIQCKCYSTDLGNKPVQEAFAGKQIYNCQVAAVLTNRYFTPGGKGAAKATGVLLWDRDKLRSFIQNS